VYRRLPVHVSYREGQEPGRWVPQGLRVEVEEVEGGRKREEECIAPS
jgi:hypothetical protein